MAGAGKQGDSEDDYAQPTKRRHCRSTLLLRPTALTYTVAVAVSPLRCRLSLAPLDPQRELPATDNTVPPISPRFLNTTLNMTDTPGVISPLRIPDWVTEPINAMHSSW